MGWLRGNQRLLRLCIGLVLTVTLGTSLYNALPARAAVSDNLNFQARLEGINGAIANDGDYNVEFKLYKSLSAGASAQGVCVGGVTDDCLWLETRTGANKVRVVNGYLTVNLGDVTAFPSGMAWDQSLYITMNIGGTGAPTWDGEMSPRLKLTAVPYAFQAKSASQLQVSNGANVGTLSFTAPTATRNILLPDDSGTVCLQLSNACGFALATGSSAYINNSTALQNSANFNIQSAATGSVTAVIQALTGQTANLLQFKNAAGTAALSGFNSSGQLYYQSGNFTGTIVQAALGQNTTYTLPDPGAAADTFCLLSLANCTGTGGGIAGAGTQNYISKFDTAGGNHIGDSSIYDNGSFVGINTTANNGRLSVVSTNASQAGAYIEAAGSATTPALTLKGGATPGTGGNLLDFRDSSGTLLATVTADGSVLTGAKAVVGSITTPSGTVGQLTVVAAGGANVGAVVRAGASQTGSLLQIQDDAGNVNAAFNATGNQLTLGRIAGSGTVTQGKLVLGDGTTDNFSLTLQSGVLTANSVVTVPNAGGNDTVCLMTLANCTGTGGGIAGSGTQNYIAKFDTLGGNHIGDSSIYNDGSFVGIGTTTNSGLLSLLGSVITQPTLFAQSAANATTPVAIIKGGATPGSGGDLLQLQQSNGTVVASFDANGKLVTTGGADITGAVTINTTGTSNTTIGNATGNFSLTSSALNVTTAGAVSGVTTLQASGAITAATSGNTINGLIINSGALSGITDYAQGSGNFAISGSGTFSTATGAINLNGNTSVTGSNTLTVGTGAVTFGSLGAGLVISDASGLLSSGAVDRNSGTYFNTALTVANGGTGAASFASNGILFGNGTGAIQATAAAANSVLVTNGSNVPSLSQTLPTQVQDNITRTGALVSGSIASGFGTISTGNNISTTAALQGGSLTVTGGATIQGAAGLGLGVASTTTGKSVFYNSGGSGDISLQGAATNSNFTLTLPAENGTLCSTGSICTGYAAASPSGSFVQFTPGSAQVDSTTNSSIFINKTGASGNLLTLQNNGTNVLTVATGGATTINTNSTTALKVEQTGVNNNVFVVDTANGLVGIGGAPSTATGRKLQVTGSVSLTNNLAILNSAVNDGNITKFATGGTNGVGANDVVVMADDSGNARVVTSTTARDTRVYGVAALSIASAGTGSIIVAGHTSVNADTGAVAIGDQLVVSSFSDGTHPNGGYVTVDNNATTGILGYATSSKAGGSVGTVGVRIQITAGQTNPTIGGNLTVQGSTTLNLGAGIVQSDAGGLLSSSAVDRNSATLLSGTLSVANGGTGATSFTANGIVFGNGTSPLQVTAAAANSILVTDGSNVPSLSQTLPLAVQGNITQTGALASGSITTGFGTISTANNISTTAALQGNIVNATTGFQVNGAAASGSYLRGDGTNFVASTLQAGDLTGTIFTVAGSSGTNQTISSGDTLSILRGGSNNLTTTGSATDTITIDIVSNPTFAGLITANGGLTVATGSTFTNASSTLLTAVAIANHAANGDIGTAATTVNVATTFDVTQTTAGIDLTLPSPTPTTSGRIVYINSLAGNASFTMYGVTITAGKSQSFIWNGSAWVPAGVDTGGNGASSVGAVDGAPGGANAFGGEINSNVLYLQSASVSFPGLVNTTTQTFAGDKTFNDITTFANNVSITGSSTLTTGSGTVTFGSLGAGLVQSSAGGALSSGAVDRNSSTFFSNTLNVANGGTGLSTVTSNGVLYGNGTGNLQVTAAGTSGQILQANGSGVPTFVSFSGDASVAAGGAVTINSLQGNTLTISSPTSGQYLRYNGSAFVNSSIQAADITGTLFTLAASSGTSQNVTQGQTVSILAGASTNLTTVASATNTVTIDIVNNPTFTGLITGSSNTTGLALTGTPVAGTGTTSLLQLGGAISGGNNLANGGTYIGVNLPSSGAGSAADFLNFQAAGTSRLRVTSAGNTTIGGTLTVAGNTTLSSLGAGLVQSNASGLLSSGAVDRNSSTYFNTALTVANGGTGLTTITSNGVVYGNGTGNVGVTAAGTGGQLLIANGSGVPTFATLSGDATLSSTGSLNITSLQGNTLTISSPASGQYLRYNGSAFVNSGLQAADLTGTIFSVAGSAGTNQTISAGDTLSILRGSSNNLTTTASATDTLTIDIISNPTFAGLVTLNGGATLPSGTQLTNAGSTLLSAMNISDKASGGDIGTAAATVDAATTFNVDQTTSGQNLTLPDPTGATAGRLAYVNNVSSNNTSFTMGSVTLNAGASATFIWNGSDWVALTTGSSVTGVTTIGAIDTPTTSADGAHISGNTLYLQSATASVPGLVNTASQTFAGNKTFNGALTISGANAFTTGTGAITLSGRGAGLVITNSSGVVSTGAVDRNSSTYFNTALTVANGGTGLSTLTANGILFGNGTGNVGVTAAGTQGQLLFAGSGGAPAFSTVSGDITSSTSTTGQLTVASLQGNTLTITSPTSGQFLKYNGSAFVNSAITAGDVTGTLFTLAGSSGTSQNVTSGSTVTIAQGGSGNLTTVASATNTVTVDIIQNPTFTGTVTLSKSNGVALDVSGTPTASATVSQLKLGNAITGGNAVANGGTYIGINLPASGAGSTADFVNFQSNGTVQLKVTNNGTITAGGLTNGGTGGLITSDGSGVLSSSAVDRNSSTYFNTALTVANGGTGATTLTSNGVLFGNGAGAIQATAAGTDAQFLLSNSGTPVFRTLSGDASLTNTGALTINSLQGNTLTISSPTSGQYLRYNGSAFVNANITTADISGTLFTVAGSSGTSQTISAGDTLSILRGASNNLTTAGSATDTITVDIVQNPTFTDTVTVSKSTGVALDISGTPTASATVSQLKLGNAIAGGNAVANGGTYIGINLPAAGSGSVADFLNFQANGTVQLRITSAGQITAGGLTNGGSGGIITSNGSGALSSGALDRNSSTYFNTTLSVANGGTGATTLTSKGILYGNGTGAVQATAAGTQGQVLFAGATGTPAFTTISGDITSSASTTGQLTVASLQGNTLTISSPTSGQYLRYNGTAFVNSALQASDLSGTLFTVTGSAGTNQAISSGDTLSILRGASNNLTTVGSATDTITIDIVQNPTFTGTITASNSSGVALAVSGTPTAGATTSLLQLGGAIAGGNNTAGTGGTYLGINSPASGAGSTADFVNFQSNGTVQLKVTNNGTITAGGLTNGGTGGLITSDGSGVLSSSAVDRNSSTYFNAALTVANGGTGATTLTSKGILYGNGTSAVQATAAGTQGQILFAGATGTPAFTTPTGDITSSTGTTGQLTVASLQGNTLTISSPTSGQYLRYNGSAFVNSALQAGDISGTIFTVAASSGTNQTVSSGDTLSILRGASNNLTTVGSATDTITVDIVQNPTFTDTVTLTKSNGTALDVSGTPTASATVSQLKLGTAIVGGNAAANGGTYLGINLPGSGAGSAADFLNFQANGTVQLRVTSAGQITAGGLTNGGSGGIITSNGSGVLSSGALDRNNSTYFNTALTVANGGTGATTLTSKGILYGNGTSAVQATAAGTQGQILFAGATGTPAFTTVSGDISSSTGTTGQLTVASLQGNTLTISSPTSGQYLRYNGSAFVNANITAGDISGTLFSTNSDSGTGAIDRGDTLFIQGGTNGIDTALSGDTYTLNLDTTEIGTTTFGANSDFTWTFNPAGVTNPTIAFANDALTVTAGTTGFVGALTVSQGASINRTLAANSGSTQNVGSITFSSPADTSGTNTSNGLNITPTIGNATGGTNTANIINIGNLTGDDLVTLNAVKIGNLTGTAASETALNIGTGWDTVLSVGGTPVINGSGQLIASQLTGTLLNTNADSGAAGTLVQGDTLTINGNANGIDTALSGDTWTVALDTTEIGTTTFGSGADFTWTFNSLGGTDPTIGFSNNLLSVGGGLALTQGANASSLALTNTGATSASMINLTHNTSAYTGTAILLNLANGSGSFASGNFLDFQKNSVSQFSVAHNGNLDSKGTGTFEGNTLSVGTANTTASLRLATSATDFGILQVQPISSGSGSVTYNLPGQTGGVSVDICVSTGNCASAGGGVTTLGGTTNFIAKFTGAQTIGNSNIYQDATGVSIGGTSPVGLFNVGGTNQFQIASNGDITNSGTYNTNTFTSSALQFGAASAASIQSASTRQLNINTINGGNVTIGNATSSSTTIVLQDGSASSLTVDNIGTAIAGTFTTTGSANTGSLNTLNPTASGTSGNNLVNGLSIALAGTNNATGTNTVNAINLANVTPRTNNTFNGLNFGTGYNNYITSANYNVTAAGAVTQAQSLTINAGGASITGPVGITGALTQAGGNVDLNATGTSTTKIAAISNSGTIDIGNGLSGAILIQGGSTFSVSSTNFDVDATGNVSHLGYLHSGSAAQFQVDATGNVQTTGQLLLSRDGTGTNDYTLGITGRPVAQAGSAQLRLGSALVTGNTTAGTGGTYIGINQPSSGLGSTADFLNFESNGVNKLRVTTAGDTTISGYLNVGTGYRIGGTAPAGHFLRGNGTNYVDGTLQSSDGAGIFILKSPSNTTDNTLQPAASGVVGLSLKAFSGASDHILDVYDNANVLQSYFDSGAFLNSSKVYVSTVATLNAATANGITIQPGTSSSAATGAGVTINANTGTTNNGTIAIGTSTTSAITLAATATPTTVEGTLTVNGMLNPATPTITAFSSGGSLASGTYYYRVAAVSAAGVSTEAVPVSTFPQGTTGGPSNNHMQISWSAVTGAANYKIYKSTDGQASWSVATVGSGTLSIDDGNGGPTFTGSATLPIKNAAAGITLNGGGGVNFNGPNGGSITLEAAPASTSTFTLRLPTGQGGSNTVLLNDGFGNLSWVGTAGCSTCVATIPTTTSQNTIHPTANGVVSLTIQGTSGTGSPNILDIQNAGGGTTYASFGAAGLLTLNAGLTIQTGGTFQNDRSSIFTATSLSFGSSGAIGTAATTVDVATSFNITTTTASLTLSIPAPTTTTAGRIAYLSNVGATNSFTVTYGSGGTSSVIIAPGNTAIFYWTGAGGYWASAGVDGSGANFVQNQSSTDQIGNFRINGTGRANTSLLTPILDVATAGVLQIGNTTATTVTIAGNGAAHGINIGHSSGGDNDILLGSSNAGSTINIEAGTAASAIQIGNGATAHGIQIGSSASGDNDILLGSSNAGSTITIDAGTAANGIQIGNSTTAHDIKIGAGGTAAQTVTVGSTSSTSALTLQASGQITANSTGLLFSTGGTRTINVTTQTTANTAGNNLALQAATGNGTGAGGQLTLTGGTGGTSGAGGAVAITGGAPGGGNAAGGAITLTGGGGSGTGAGGAITLQAGAAGSTAGSPGGAVTINASNGTSTGTGGAGGSVTITAGSSGGTADRDGSNVTLVGGARTGTTAGFYNGQVRIGSNTSFGGSIHTQGFGNTTNTTQAVSAAALGYVLAADLTTNVLGGASITTNVNVTGVPSIEGSIVYFTTTCSKGATLNNALHTCNFQINGVTIANMTNANGNTALTTTSVTRSYTVAYMNGAWRVVGEGTIGTLNTYTPTNTTADYAEWIRYSGDVQPQPGDVLIVGDEGISVKQSGSAYDSRIVGVVSTTPYQVGGVDDGHSVILALAGRVPVKVSLESGAIQAGDPLTSSSTAGVAMKASGKGKIIGYALENYDGTQSVAQVMTQLQPSYNDPTPASTIQGGQSVTGDLNVAGNLSVNGDLSVVGLANVGTLYVAGGANIGGQLNVDGATNLKDLVVSGNTSLANLAVAGSANFASLNVSGAATLADLTVTGSTTTGNLTVNGMATVATLKVMGIAEIGSDVAFSGVGQTRNAITKKFKASGVIHAGDVVIADPNADGQVMTTTAVADTRVLGIAVSDAQNTGDEVTVAIGGSVQVKTPSATVKAGDLLVSSNLGGQVDPGTNPPAGSIIGKALGKPNNGLIWVLVMLH